MWAILVLAIQPSLLDPSPLVVGASLFKGVWLIVAALGASRMFLPRLFAFIAKVPELMLVTALAWCFLISGMASALGLSREMGALIAGVGLSTLPYNLDVIAKVINIRDFFVTLFFVALGHADPGAHPRSWSPSPWARRCSWSRAASCPCFRSSTAPARVCARASCPRSTCRR